MDEYHQFSTPQIHRLRAMATGTPKERPAMDMKELIERRFADGEGILPVDTRDDDATIAEKVRNALAMANGKRVAMIQWNDPSEQTASEAAPLSTTKKQLQDLRIFRDLLEGATVEDLASTYDRYDLERGHTIERGLQLINEVLELHLDQLAMEGSLQAPGGTDTWVTRAMDAIQSLKLQPDMGAHN